MKDLARLLPLLLCLAAAPAFPGGSAADGATRFARILDDAEGRPEALQVAIVTYAKRADGGGVTVDLVSAVHVADAAYYASLNDRFRRYDALLYELILPGQPDAPEAHAASAGFLSGTQIGLKNLLGLAFQLDEIDYGAANFVHADLTSDLLAQRMSERGESLYVYLWRMVVASIEDYARDPFGLKRSQRMSGALAADSGSALKAAMAYEMVEAARRGDILGGPNGSAIIDARNEHAVRVLREQLDAGAERVAIFYGVAHMPDLERRLADELALQRAGIEWVDAWRLRCMDDTAATPGVDLPSGCRR